MSVMLNISWKQQWITVWKYPKAYGHNTWKGKCGFLTIAGEENKRVSAYTIGSKIMGKDEDTDQQEPSVINSQMTL